MKKPIDDVWVRFDRDWDYDHPALTMTTLAFYAGQERRLSRPIADAAIAASAAVEIPAPEEAEAPPSTDEHDPG